MQRDRQKEKRHRISPVPANEPDASQKVASHIQKSEDVQLGAMLPFHGDVTAFAGQLGHVVIVQKIWPGCDAEMILTVQQARFLLEQLRGTLPELGETA